MSETESSFHKSKGLNLNGSTRIIKTDDSAEFHVQEESVICYSDYFQKLFEYETSHEVLISGISGEIMNTIISFMETKTAELHFWNVVDLLKAAVINNQSVVDNADIADLSLQHFQRLLSDNLNVTKEEEVWNAIVKWVGTDKDAKYEAVPLLLCCIRYNYISESFIQNMMEHELVTDNEYCRSLVELYKQKSPENVSLRTHLIKCLNRLHPDVLISSPRYRHPQGMACLVFYDRYNYDSNQVTLSIRSPDDANKTIMITSFPDLVPKFVVSYGARVEIFDFNGKFAMFDFLKREWLPFPQPPEKFDRIAFTKLNHSVHAVMTSGTKAMSATFDHRTEKWKLGSSKILTKCKVKIYCMEAADLEGLIYVVAKASVDKLRCVSFATVYNPETDSWFDFALPKDALPDQTRTFSMVAHEGALYFVWRGSSSMYKFDPSKGKWTTCRDIVYSTDASNPVMLKFISGKAACQFDIDDHHSCNIAMVQSHFLCHFRNNPDVFWEYSKLFWKQYLSPSHIE